MGLIWDGRSMLELTVSARHRNRLHGLCGNFNGNPKDDFTDPKGKEISTALEFAEIWKLGEGGRFCSQRPPKV